MLQIIDIKWKLEEGINRYFSALQVRDTETSELKNIPLKDFNFNFSLSEEKNCIGYYSEKGFMPCPINSINKPNQTQCYTCEKLQGFKSAFLFGEEPNEYMKEHLSQKHYIYIAFFAPNLLKVGTAAYSRKEMRPIEQDALIYSYIAENNGFEIQKLEHEISRRFNIHESVKISHKIKVLGIKPNIKTAETSINAAFSKIKSGFSESIYKEWLYDQCEIINLSDLPQIFYPDKELFFQKDELHIFGQYKGLRGRFLILKNDDNYFAFDIKYLVGRNISYIDNWQYNIDMTQMNLGI